MRWRTLLMAALVGLVATARGEEPNRHAKEVDELQALTQRRFDANAQNDRAFYEALLAPNFLLLQPFSFPAKDKEAYLDEEFPKGRPPRPRSTITDFQARVAGETAVVSYEVVEPFPLGGGQAFESHSRRLDTYVRIDGAWRLTSMAVAEPPSWPQVVQVAARVYSEYQGSYRLSPESIAVVTNENGRLMLQMPGQSKVELFPESASSFFDKTDSPLARTTFERDASGTVVAQVYRSGGQQLRAARIR